MSKSKPRRSSKSVSSETVSPLPGGVPAPANSSPGPKPAAKAARLQRSARRRGWAALVFPASVLLVVIGIVLATYWPALSAQALYLDDDLYLGSPLVQQPGWSSVQRLFGEVLAPRR